MAAHCKNSVDGLWYCFDDSDVQPLSEEEVCTQTAYILFYQRRTAIPSWSANSSVAGKAGSLLGQFFPEQKIIINGAENFSRKSHDSVSLVRLVLTFAFNLETKMIAIKEMEWSVWAAEFTWRWSRAWLKVSSGYFLVE